MTLCGTCRWWDHERAAEDERKSIEHVRHLVAQGIKATHTPGHRIAPCLWGKDLKLPEWCDGFRGMRQTNEAGTTKRGCEAWEELLDQDAIVKALRDGI
jgi:hypothetical protein